MHLDLHKICTFLSNRKYVIIHVNNILEVYGGVCHQGIVMPFGNGLFLYLLKILYK